MFAGLPGIGVGTLFYVLIALWLPLRECGHVINGTSSRQRWRTVGVQFLHGVSIIASIALAEEVMMWVLGLEAPHAIGPARMLNEEFAAMVPDSVLAAPITASLILLAGVLLLIEVIRVISTARSARRLRATAPTEVTLSEELLDTP